VDSESGLIHSVETTAANAHDLTPATELLHGQDSVINADAGYHGIEKRSEMEDRGIGFRVAMRPGKRRALPGTPEGRLDDLIGTAKSHIRAKNEHPLRVI
jgi:IS5 family transposase